MACSDCLVSIRATTLCKLDPHSYGNSRVFSSMNDVPTLHPLDIIV